MRRCCRNRLCSVSDRECEHLKLQQKETVALHNSARVSHSVRCAGLQQHFAACAGGRVRTRARSPSVQLLRLFVRTPPPLPSCAVRGLASRRTHSQQLFPAARVGTDACSCL